MSLTDGLVSYYKFDENAGTTAFDSVGSNDGTLSGTRIRSTDGKINGGGDFTQGDDAIQIDASGLGTFNDMTLGAWVKGYAPQPYAANMIAIGTNSDNTDAYDFRFLANGSVRALFATNVTVPRNRVYKTTTQTGFDNSNRRLIIAEFNQSTQNITITIDDIEYSGTQVNEGIVSNIDVNDDLAIGGRLSGFNNFYCSAMIDEVFIYNRNLSESEKTELYNDGNGLSYPFTTPSGKKNNIFMYS